jgi:histone arginine demethylase JMJD6
MYTSDTDTITGAAPAPLSIDKRDYIPRKEFIKDYVEISKPIILTQAAKSWKAMGKFTPQYFKEKYGDRKKTIKGIEYTFAELIDRIMISTPQNPAPYPFNLNIELEIPELKEDITPELSFGKIDRINHPLIPRYMLRGTALYEIFFGGNGSSFPYLHYDMLCMNTQITQVYGSKEFIFFPPEQGKFLYPQADNPKLSPIDVFNPDYEKYPLFRNAQPLRVTLLEGETLFFPTRWWHSARIYEPCITIGRAQLNGVNWNLFLDDEFKVWKKRSRPLAYAMMGYGKLAGAVMDIQEKFMS